MVNDAAEPGDYVMTASGGLPGELIGGWRARPGGPGMDVEYGFSCMGYELAGAWGAAMARHDGVVTTLLGDGSYLMLNSELYSAAFAGHGFVAVVCDNDGYAVIDRLQRGNGGSAFNNMYADCRSPLDATAQSGLRVARRGTGLRRALGRRARRTSRPPTRRPARTRGRARPRSW